MPLIRFIVTPILIAFFLLIVYATYSSQSLLPLSVLISAASIMAWVELRTILQKRAINIDRTAGVLFFLSIVIENLPIEYEYLELWKLLIFFTPNTIYFFILIYLLLKLLICYDRFRLEDLVATVGCALYIYFLQFGLKTLFIHYGEEYTKSVAFFVLFLLITNKGADIFAYLVGKTFGQTPFAPKISPAKTWEGAIAGWAAGTIGGYLFIKITYPFFEYPLWVVFYSGLVTASGILGDLVESCIKRWAGVKDSSNIFGEMGGVLDMIDSFLISAPCAYFLSRVFTSLGLL